MRTRLAGAVVLLGVCMAADGADAADTRAAARAKCIYVDGLQQCVKPGQRCKRRFRRDYLVGGLDCVRRRGKLRLVKAGDAALRQGRFVHLQPNGYPSLSTALQAFDKVVADLPGVKVKRGVVGDSEKDATSVMLWMDHYKKRLTRKQRAVLRRVMSGGQVLGAQAVSSQVTPEQAQEWAALADVAQDRLEAHGMSFPHQIRHILGSTTFKDKYAAWVWAEFLDGGTTCDIHVTPKTLAEDVAWRRTVVLHELAHCAQAEFAGKKADLVGRSSWVVEGSADWVAATVGMEWVNRAEGMQDAWDGWLGSYWLDVTTRQYDAIGFFALLAHQGVDVWSMIGPLVNANRNGNSDAAYNLAVTMAGNLARDWGPTHVTQPLAGKRWDLNGPAMPHGQWVNANIRNGVDVDFPLQKRAGVGATLNVQADVLTVSPTFGVVGWFQKTTPEELELVPSLYCTRPEGCECDGEDIGAEPMPKGGALIGYSATDQGGTVRLRGDSLDAYCKRANQPFKAGYGITLYDAQSENGSIIAEFPRGPCRVDRKGFHASAVSGAYRLEAEIPNFKKFTTNGGIYEVDYEAGGAHFTVKGPGGPYSNVYWPAGSKAPPGGVMGFGDGGRTFGIGMYPVMNSAGSSSVIVLGGMKCVYPPPRRRG